MLWPQVPSSVNGISNREAIPPLGARVSAPTVCGNLTSVPAHRGRDRWLWGAAGLCALGLGLWLGSACLPDLGERAPLVSPPDAAPLSPRGSRCGDGIIQLEADYAEECDPGDAGVDAASGCRPDTCTVACEGVVDPRTKHCYFTLPGPVPYENAREACEARGAHVLTLGSAAELSTLREYAPFRVPFVWVGLKQATSLEVPGYLAARNDEPGWPLPPLSSRCEGCFAVVSDGGVAFSPFQSDAGPALCVVARLDDGGDYRAASCTARDVVPLCEREPVGETAEPCFGGLCVRVLETRARKRYLFVREALVGAEARQSCVGLGGRLAVLSSRLEREQVGKALSDRVLSLREPKLTVWIGLGNQGTGWRWDDDTNVEPASSPWGNDAPEIADGATPSAFAYMVLANNRVYDAQLAHADDGALPRAYLCELPP